ncbi:hypothetical protein F0919_02630 [Taibaiella lutea]|uniref:Uncharacterized protein n=1 Tax=Taibaiella lutea TaxID=2608001 RepID=A0A5M6CNG3_9BACT|nr:hypothetical protein [Taibaiella lutea]KAA5536583.1 hypothetical protein F0919_02630 [Taibaiella lutea]
MKRNAIKYLFLTFSVLCFPVLTRAQVLDTGNYFAPILIDEIIINSKENFNIGDFINRIKSDTTFYKAFRSMHLVTYNAENDIKIFEKKGTKIKASLQSETKQIYRNGCRTMNVLDEKVTGDFYDKKRNYNYYTAELFASLFFTKGKVCGENNIVKGKLEEESGGSSIEKNKAKLKQLMFNPGSKISGIPLMGNKSAIFEPDVARMYDFKLSVDTKNGIDCYVFEATPKPGFLNDVVYRKFKTWFRQSDYSIISRDYALVYNTIAYDFNVVIHVDLEQKGQMLLPSYISYNGNWFAFTKGREKVTFTAKFDY